MNRFILKPKHQKLRSLCYSSEADSVSSSSILLGLPSLALSPLGWTCPGIHWKQHPLYVSFPAESSALLLVIHAFSEVGSNVSEFSQCVILCPGRRLDSSPRQEREPGRQHWTRISDTGLTLAPADHLCAGGEESLQMDAVFPCNFRNCSS